MKSKKVVIALSGGVDSSVAAYLLKEQGYNLIALFMKNWHDENLTISDECPWLEDSNDAMLIADKLKIPFKTVDLSKEYKKRIIDYMFKEYSNGRTPNPDILCNKEIKFDVFMKLALSLDADYIATGHYSQIKSTNNSEYRLLQGIDKVKDQSYFLCQLNQKQLSKILFPIGHLKKSEVRDIAKKNSLITADKRDSQGLCFVGKIRLPEFLQQQLAKKKGDIIEIPSISEVFSLKSKGKQSRLNELSKKYKFSKSDGKVIGEHNGAYYYTIGQRKGLAVGGYDKPLFVIGIDTKSNKIYVGKGKNHPGLIKKVIKIDITSINWVNDSYSIDLIKTLKLKARIRYRQPLQDILLHIYREKLYVEFKKYQTAITSGQFLALYHKNELIASSVIP
ncbi:MAG: tRNA 2-thiouridine(34) synthase MnmA [Bacteroidota bacterium]|nr:tRNA 2-thiouridine(34) synthase MnmA [Bacteroidota bacterium]